MATWNVKTKRKTPFEMNGCRRSRLESNEDKAVDGEDEEQTAMETGFEMAKAHPGL